MATLHQALPMLHRRDAVGTHVRLVQQLLHQRGVESEIYVDIPDPETARTTRSLDDYAGGPVLYHHAVSSRMVPALIERVERLAVYSHNCTPERFFAAWDAHLVTATAQAETDLAAVVSRASLAIAASEFSAADVRRLGAAECAVVPVLFPLPQAELPPACPADDRQWLFVGRIVPNKAQHDLVLALKAARLSGLVPDARLVLAGSISSRPYHDALRRLIAELELDHAVELTGPISDDRLDVLYRRSGTFVCASEHEGFCVPLIEAMHRGLPVVAFASSAVTETVGDGGIVTASKRPLDLARSVAAVLDPIRRQQLIASGHRRATRFSLHQTRAEMWDVLRPLL